jgi:hypothetical protein
VDVDLGDSADRERVARVFKGWLGDRASYSGFDFGDLDWLSDPAQLVGIGGPAPRRSADPRTLRVPRLGGAGDEPTPDPQIVRSVYPDPGMGPLSRHPPE